MTDYAEEQKNEIEALESIYPSEFEVLETEPFYAFAISIKTDDFEEGGEEGAAFKLVVNYLEKYPDSPPIISVKDAENMDEDDIQSLMELLENEAVNNVGMVMVFLLVSAAQEWLNSRADRLIKEKQEELEREEKEKEEAEFKKFEGTRVTVETFLTWKIKFDADMLNLKKIMQKEEQVSKKLTGRELFERDQSLNESDIQFIQGDGDDEIQVDESLFQEYEDLI